MNLTHHAYFYEGEKALLQTLLHSARERLGFAQEHHPDVHVREFEAFGVSEARALRELASLKPSSGRALYCVALSSITAEAQQALLKTLEEPGAGATFVLLVPHGSLLPTVRSRMLAYPELLKDADTGDNAAKTFLTAPHATRSAMIAKLLKDDENVRERARVFLTALEVELYARLPLNPKLREGLEDVAKIRSYLTDRSPSLKMLLEHLASSLPKL